MTYVYRALATWLTLSLLWLPANSLAVEDEDPADSPTQLALDDLRTFTDVFNLVRLNYVDEVGDRDLLESAMLGLVTSLDPHSTILTEDDFQDSDDNSRGRYGGVGIEIEVEDSRIYVGEVIPESPAYRAGVQVGDLILEVNSVPVKGRPIMQSFQAMHGEPGSEVTLRLSTGDMAARDLTMVREYIPVQSVRSEIMDGDVAYFHVTHFHAQSATDLEQEMARIRDELGTEPKGIVLDLRGNLGGVITAATAMADGFLDEGLVVYTRGRYAATQLEFYAQPGEWAPDVPMVVLVDRLTASSSEILAGALRDHDRAVIVGEATYGKGTVQSLLQLRNGHALKLTTARFFTPSGQEIDKVGITPHHIVAEATEDSDPPLDKALELLETGESAGSAGG